MPVLSEFQEISLVEIIYKSLLEQAVEKLFISLERNDKKNNFAFGYIQWTPHAKLLSLEGRGA